MSVCKECSDAVYKLALKMAKSEEDEVVDRRKKEEEFWRRHEGSIKARVVRSMARSLALAASGLGTGEDSEQWLVKEATQISKDLGMFAAQSLESIRSESKSMRAQMFVQRFPDRKSRIGGAALELRRAGETLSGISRISPRIRKTSVSAAPSIHMIFDIHHAKK